MCWCLDADMYAIYKMTSGSISCTLIFCCILLFSFVYIFWVLYNLSTRVPSILAHIKNPYSSSCLGPENSSCEMKPFLSLSSCWKISSTSLSFSASMFFSSSESWPSTAVICFFRYSLTCREPNISRVSLLLAQYVG